MVSSNPSFYRLLVTRSLVLYVCFIDHCLSFCAFTFGHCVVCSSSIYGFWLTLWYLQTLLIDVTKTNFNWRVDEYSQYIITLLPFFIEMLQYDWLWSGHMIKKEMFYIPIKLKPELARASMTTSDVNNQWRSNFQQQII